MLVRVADPAARLDEGLVESGRALMAILIAGLAAGVFMAQIFVTVGCLTAFFALKNPPPALAIILARFPPGAFVMTAVIFAYPLWGIIGLVSAFLFIALENGAPGGGLGSPNIVYTVGVTLAAIALALPISILARQLWPGVACTAVACIMIFGWLLPLLAS